MDKSATIDLIKKEYVKDEFGVRQVKETRRTVFCSVSSVTQREFFEGGRNGLNPEYKFTVFAYDYEDEPVVEYGGKRLSVYRTYMQKNDNLELYCERKGGTNGNHQDGTAQQRNQ